MKIKLEEDFEDDRKIDALSPRDAHQDLARELRTQVEMLDSNFSSIEHPASTLFRFSDYAKNEEIVNWIVEWFRRCCRISRRRNR